MKNKVFVFTICFLSIACELYMDQVYRIFFYNKSTHSVALFLADRPEDGSLYPDTLPQIKKETALIKRISPNNHFFPIDSWTPWDNIYAGLPKDTMSIYIIHSDTLSKYGWENVIKQYKILRRYDLSFHDLNLLEYKISYPPTEIMKNMKMYPRYGK